MFDLLDGDVGDLDAAAALTAAADLRGIADRAEARLLQVAAHFADLHPGPELSCDDDGVVLPGTEDTKVYGGPGCPGVAEFAPVELGAVLGITSTAATRLIGDALALRHRLPRTWARVVAGDVQAWRARQIAAACWLLSQEAAALVDARVCDIAQTLTSYRLAKVVRAAVMEADPDAAEKDARSHARERGVWVGRSDLHGTKELFVKAAAGDVIRFDATVDLVADLLAAHGDTDPKDLRRAKAIGYLADPQATLTLIQSPSIPADPPGPADGAVRRTQPDGGLGRYTLYVHLTDLTLATGSGLLRVGDSKLTERHAGKDGLGPLLARQLADLIGDSRLVDKITVKPVIDLADRISVDAYEIPSRIRERVLLRYATCIFPYCNHPATSSIDLDHVVPYDHSDTGPPGQTSTENLGPCCRRHHRLKTHGRWMVRRIEDGGFEWTSPHGHRYRVDHSGTHILTMSDIRSDSHAA